MNVPTSKVDKWLQAGQYAELQYFLRYSARSLTRRGVPELRQLKFFARGAGVSKKASADRGMLQPAGRPRHLGEPTALGDAPHLGHDRRQEDEHAAGARPAAALLMPRHGRATTTSAGTGRSFTRARPAWRP